MPSFLPIGLKLWALEGYTQTDRQTDKQTDKPSYFNYIDDEITKEQFQQSMKQSNLGTICKLKHRVELYSGCGLIFLKMCCFSLFILLNFDLLDYAVVTTTERKVIFSS